MVCYDIIYYYSSYRGVVHRFELGSVVGPARGRRGNEERDEFWMGEL